MARALVMAWQLPSDSDSVDQSSRWTLPEHDALPLPAQVTPPAAATVGVSGRPYGSLGAAAKRYQQIEADIVAFNVVGVWAPYCLNFKGVFSVFKGVLLSQLQ